MRPIQHMTLLVTARTTKIMATCAIVLFLLLHLVMEAIFINYDVTVMVYYGAVTAPVYLILLVLLWREYWRTFAALIYLQVFTYMGLAVLCVGWDAGFQLTLIAMNVLGFYAEFAARAMRVKTFHGMTFSIIGMVEYLVLLWVTSHQQAPYSLPDNVELGLTTLWSVAVFALAIVYLQLFIIIARNSVEEQSSKALHDRLTALPNRYYMSEYLGKVAADEGLDSYWAAMADIDDFKHINDTYGHNCGDYVLRTLADIMNDGGTSKYTLCRWGGEEFLLTGRVESDLRLQWAELDRLRQTIEEHGFWYEDIRLNLTVTIGLAQYQEGQSISEWVNSADKKLYEGKQAGKNRVMM